MKRLFTLTLTVMATVALAAGHSEAQVTAVGPYYPTPSWDQKLPASTRFVVLSNWGGAAVLDRETGLVWQKTLPAIFNEFSWFAAHEYCNDLNVGNRKGWRLPGLQELASLVDPSVPSPGPTLPSGHPFENVQQGGYWSSTTHVQFSTWARVVVFFNGTVVNGTKDGIAYAWCVRGGQGVDAQ